MNALILYAMIFCHLYADYNMQGILAQLKQREWWRQNAPTQLYNSDYIMALIEHSFMWSFITTLPLTAYYLFTNPEKLTIMPLIWIINTIIHTYVDDLKANAHTINLLTDQICHLIQIILTWILYISVNT